MPTSYPGANDSFNVPSAPATTPLSSTGSASRNHVQSHQDMGDAIVAVQTNAALLTHDHSGTEARPTSKLAQANTHQLPDTDTAPTALHHTLGTGANQAAAGNHTHDYNSSSILNQPYRICTSTTRPSTPSIGMSIYETDTGCFRIWVAFPPAVTASWRLLPHGQVPIMKLAKGQDQWVPNYGTFIEWHTAYENTFGGFSQGSSLTNLYVLEPGRYFVEWDLTFSGSANNVGHGLRVNGSPPWDVHDYGLYKNGSTTTIHGSAEIRCNASDYISIWVWNNIGGLFSPNGESTWGVGTSQESRILARYVGM